MSREPERPLSVPKLGQGGSESRSQNEQEPRRLLDIEGAAEHLTVSVRYMRTLVAERRIPYLKVGKYIRFDLAELNRWLDGCRVDEAS